MKARLLFLAKLFIFSLILFALWEAPPPIGFRRWYSLLLRFMVRIVYPIFFAPGRRLRSLDKIPYYLIPFVSLVLATPKIRFLRKIKLILVGFIIFFAFDFLTTVSGVNASIQFRGISNVLYYTTFLVLPILLWLIPLYQELGDLWKPAQDTSLLAPDRHCPICGKEKAGMIQHIRAAHGEKSLKSRKVRRFISKSSLTR